MPLKVWTVKKEIKSVECRFIKCKIIYVKNVLHFSSQGEAKGQRILWMRDTIEKMTTSQVMTAVCIAEDVRVDEAKYGRDETQLLSETQAERRAKNKSNEMNN